MVASGDGEAGLADILEGDEHINKEGEGTDKEDYTQSKQEEDRFTTALPFPRMYPTLPSSNVATSSPLPQDAAPSKQQPQEQGSDSSFVTALPVQPSGSSSPRSYLPPSSQREWRLNETTAEGSSDTPQSRLGKRQTGPALRSPSSSKTRKTAVLSATRVRGGDPAAASQRAAHASAAAKSPANSWLSQLLFKKQQD